MMSLLTEILKVRQIPNEPQRRWFRSDDLDKPHSEHALMWTAELGFLHTAVDNGEGIGVKYKETPILVAGGHFDVNRLSDRFVGASALLPRVIAEFVGGKLRQHPNYVTLGKGILSGSLVLAATIFGYFLGKKLFGS